MPTTRQPDPPALPRELQIEPAGRCNLSCVMCLIRSRRYAPSSGSPALMDTGLFARLVDQFPDATSLHLQGLGEPLLHPQLFAMAAYARKRGMRVTTNSNLLLLDESRAEACVRSGIAWVRVSIDGATPGTYGAIRSGSRLGKVVEHIGLLRKVKERLRSETPGLRLVMVAMNRNVHELPDIVRLAHEQGMEEVFVQHLCSDAPEGDGAHLDPHTVRFLEQESLRNCDPVRLEERFREARDLARELNIELRLPKTAPAEKPVACDWPWRSVYITWDGKVMPCCMIALPERLNFGTVGQEGVLPVWQGEQYRNFRRRLRSADPPGVCRTCSVYRGSF